jgi:deoxyadenosine/deoxycytidine kinase
MVYIVAIDGIIGSGKSSLITQLGELFTCFQEPVHEWSLLQNFYDDMPKYAAPFQFQVLFSFHKLYSTFKNVNDKVILERCPWSSKHIFTDMLVKNGHIQPNEYNFYCNFYDKLAFTTDTYIYLKVDTDVAYERILNRNRASERSLKLEYLNALNDKYNESVTSLENVHIIDANKPLQEVQKDVITILNNL